jgi:iduronate 2-sulfatase
MKILRFLVLLTCLAATHVTSSASPPNILLICVDDLKPTLACYGDPVAITPNIDALAARGVVFENAYCNQAVCSPSRNSLMTGLRPQTIGIYDLPTHFRKAVPDAITLTGHFIANGYHAEGLGKIYHVGHGNIDDQDSWSVKSWRPTGNEYQSQASLDAYERDAKGRRRGPATERADASEDQYRDAKIAAEAMKRLKRLSADLDQPFFLAVGFMKPHLPFVAPESCWALYEPDSLPMPEVTASPQNAPGYAATSGGELANYSGMRKQWPPNKQLTRHLIHGYYATTSFVDIQVGRVLDELKRLELDQNTIVVLWGDHGWHLGDHGMWCKHSNYEQAARIPVVFAGPGIDSGKTSQAMIETVDIYPTLAELSGLDAPANLDGQSFASTAIDANQPARTHVTHVYPRGGRLGRAIRDPRYRLVQWKPIGEPEEQAEIELYDYESDPLETVNIAKDQPERVAEMLALIQGQGEAKPQLKETKGKAVSATKPKKVVDRGAVFRSRDADQDGFLNMEEFLSRQPDPDRAPARFPKFDRDGDAKLSVDEYVRGGK